MLVHSALVQLTICQKHAFKMAMTLLVLIGPRQTGGKTRHVTFGGQKLTALLPPKPQTEATESGVGLVGAYFL